MKNEFSSAVFSGDVDEVYSLINAGVDINIADETGHTPLMLAVGAEDIRMIELLIARGALINKAAHEGFTALHHAVDISIDGTIQTGGLPGEEPVSVILFLLKNGADISAKSNKGDTPLDIASGYKSRKIVELLRSFIP